MSDAADNETMYFNSTPVLVIRRDHLTDEDCALVEWPNHDRSWVNERELRKEPK